MGSESDKTTDLVAVSASGRALRAVRVRRIVNAGDPLSADDAGAEKGIVFNTPVGYY